MVKAAKIKKDPHAPKKAASGYLLWSNAQRETLKAKYPDLSFIELTKKLGETWRTISDEEKKRFNDAAEKDKQRYAKEMSAYEKSPEYAKFQAAKKEQPAPSKKGEKKRKNVDKDAPKAAPSAFALFTRDIRSKVKEENPNFTFGDIGREVGLRWKKLSSEERKAFEDEAATLKAKQTEVIKAYAAKKAKGESTATKTAPKKAAPAKFDEIESDPDVDDEDEDSLEEEEDDDDDDE